MAAVDSDRTVRSPTLSAKSAYVRGARALRGGLAAVGILPVLDRAAHRSRSGAWVRSLLSIYDAAELATLDVPWWTFDAAARVDGFLAGRRGARVFEWGSGASTLWLARRCDAVVSVEHDPQWAPVVRDLLAGVADVELLVVPGVPATGAPGEVRSAKQGARDLDFHAYADAIDAAGGTFDLIVIDGRAREACLPRAMQHVAADGIVVLDNVDRRRYREAIARLRPQPEVIWTRGLTPGLPYPTRTAILRPRAHP